ncbi:MAG: hypothetical protein AAFR44_11460 [Pseudomonadota bacterium]
MIAALAALDPRIWQAVLAGAFVAAGWIVTNWQTRREAAKLRAERTRDVHRALYAEIGATLTNLDSAGALDAHRDAVLTRLAEDPDFVPFVPREHGATVFDSIVAEIHVLPRVTIDPIVAYYSLLSAIASLVEDMRGDRFHSLPAERRAAVFADYIEMKKQALSFGQHATRVIALYAEGGKAAAEAGRLNSSGGAPSGRSPE